MPGLCSFEPVLSDDLTVLGREMIFKAKSHEIGTGQEPAGDDDA